MDHKKIAKEIAGRLVRPAGNGNGYRLNDTRGKEIAWCAGALAVEEHHGNATDQIAGLIESLLKEHENRIVAHLLSEARSLKERAADLRGEAVGLDKRSEFATAAADAIRDMGSK